MEFIKKLQKKYHYTCFECGNEFTKNNEIEPFTCHVCKGIETFTLEIEEVEIIDQLCPICKGYFTTSFHLNQAISDERVRWLANMVMHYRHTHISSWNKSWNRNGYFYRNGWGDYKEYEDLKKDVNERAKRQILRKCKTYMIDNGFKVNHVIQLQNTDQQTIDLYNKLLSENNGTKRPIRLSKRGSVPRKKGTALHLARGKGNESLF